MRDDQQQFLNSRANWPARLTGEQAAWALNCQRHDIPTLVRARLLKPLANPAANGIKYFATIDVVEHSKDRHWLDRMTQAIARHWRKKNAARQGQEAARVPESGAAGDGNGHGLLPGLDQVASVNASPAVPANPMKAA